MGGENGKRATKEVTLKILEKYLFDWLKKILVSKRKVMTLVT